MGKQAWVWLSVCWLSVAASSVARAQTCTLADGCPKGFTCVTPPCAVAPVDCKPGTPCVQPTPVCDSVCEPAACQADADCGADMVCHSETISACTGVATPACAPGSKCTSFAAPTPPTCTDQTTSQCAYKYDLACTQDTDCGTGFSCNAGQECSCSGSSGTAIGRPTPAVDAGVSSQPIQPTPPPQVVSPDAGAAAKPAKDPGPSVDGGTVSQPNCECHASALKSCELQPIDCTQDSDCPASLKCSVWSEGTVSVSCAKGSDAGCVVDPSTASPEIKRCQPASKGVDRGGVATSGSLGSSTTPTTAPIASANGAAGSVASTPPVVPEASHDQQPTAATPSTTPAPACSVRTLAGSSRPFGLVGFGLAGLGLALRSRRRRNAR